MLLLLNSTFTLFPHCSNFCSGPLALTDTISSSLSLEGPISLLLKSILKRKITFLAHLLLILFPHIFRATTISNFHLQHKSQNNLQNSSQFIPFLPIHLLNIRLVLINNNGIHPPMMSLLSQIIYTLSHTMGKFLMNSLWSLSRSPSPQAPQTLPYS